MNKTIIAILTILPTLAMAASPSVENPAPSTGKEMPCHDGMPPFHRGMLGKDHMPHYLKNIELNPEQLSGIKAIMATERPDIKEKFKSERQAFVEMRKLIFSNDYSEAQAEVLIEKSLASHRQMALQKIKIDRAIFALLKPEQQQAVKTNLMEAKHFHGLE